MRIAHIVPVGNLDIYSYMSRRPKFYMLLTHLYMESTTYADWAEQLKEREPDCFIILDNSLIELGASMDFKTVIDVARAVKADEVILPDVFQDADSTYMKSREALDWYKDHKDENDTFQFQYVCHGRSYAEVAASIECGMNMPEVATLGIPKIYTATFPGGRAVFESLWEHTNKEIHLLGCYSSFTELHNFHHLSRIRSMDTCLAAYNVLLGFDIYNTRVVGTVDLKNDKIRKEDYRSFSAMTEALGF